MQNLFLQKHIWIIFSFLFFGDNFGICGCLFINLGFFFKTMTIAYPAQILRTHRTSQSTPHHNLFEHPEHLLRTPGKNGAVCCGERERKRESRAAAAPLRWDVRTICLRCSDNILITPRRQCKTGLRGKYIWKH